MAKRKSGVNKAQLVRDAIAALGKDAKPAAIQAHIKSAGGPEIPTVMISSYKSNMMKKGGGTGRRGRPARSDWRFCPYCETARGEAVAPVAPE